MRVDPLRVRRPVLQLPYVHLFTVFTICGKVDILRELGDLQAISAQALLQRDVGITICLGRR